MSELENESYEAPRRAEPGYNFDPPEDVPVYQSDPRPDLGAEQAQEENGGEVCVPADDTHVITLPEIAKKRAIQTAIQSLGTDVIVAVAMLVLTSMDSITNRAAWIAFATSLGKTVIVTAASWVIRRFRDQSGVGKLTEIEGTNR